MSCDGRVDVVSEVMLLYKSGVIKIRIVGSEKEDA